MDVFVAPSDIHGQGVLAKGPIEEGEWAQVYGKCVVFEECTEWELNRLFCVDTPKYGYLPYEPWIYLNHSNEPNCEVQGGDRDDILFVVALRDIRAGDELTIDYGYEPADLQS